MEIYILRIYKQVHVVQFNRGTAERNCCLINDYNFNFMDMNMVDVTY